MLKSYMTITGVFPGRSLDIDRLPIRTAHCRSFGFRSWRGGVRVLGVGVGVVSFRCFSASSYKRSA